MKVLILWSRISGYMAACWKQLAEKDDLDPTIVGWIPNSETDNSSFDESIVDGLNCHLFPPHGVSELELQTIARKVMPNVVVIAGWLEPEYVKLAKRLKQNGVAVVMGMDTPWLSTPKQHFAKIIRKRKLKFVDHVITAGRRASNYARHLGFRPEQITEGVYAWDESTFGEVAFSKDESVGQHSRTNGFLFVGRYVPAKGLESLLKAYSIYRQKVANPWPLTCCGAGPLEPNLVSTPGVVDLGFQAPGKLAHIMKNSNAFVFPSTYEPWGVALAEAMGAGLPAISTYSCGAALDLIEHGLNGHILPASNAGAIADSMIWLHNHPNRAQLGRCAMASAQRFTSEAWACRWYRIFRQIRSGEAVSS
jgi:glycosyltransferase involved in cell wall biosynthesis